MDKIQKEGCKTFVQYCPKCEKSTVFIILKLPEDWSNYTCEACNYGYSIPDFKDASSYERIEK